MFTIICLKIVVLSKNFVLKMKQVGALKTRGEKWQIVRNRANLKLGYITETFKNTTMRNLIAS